MKPFVSVLALIAVTWLGGCATSKNVTLAQMTGSAPVKTVAMVPEDGNSSDMDAKVRTALLTQHVTIAPPVPSGTRKSADVDAIVSYSDVWRWDIVMYLKSVTMSLFDARTGNLLVTGQWNDSAFHGFRDSQAIVQELVADMFAKLGAATPPLAAAASDTTVPQAAAR